MLSADDVRLALMEPRRLTDFTPWQAHIPFAFVVVRMARPKRLVELGTASGDSYCAFCQAVDVNGLETECAAIDTWTGDPHSGELQIEIFDDLRAHHDPLYGRFSRLIRSTFDEAQEGFADGSIDLLHIDGYHTYEVVKHDFQSWLPKMSDRGVVLLHDVAVREGDFGVWRLWEEIEHLYPSFAFPHGFGLGVVAVGTSAQSGILEFIDHARAVDSVATLFAAFGERLVARTTIRALEHAVEATGARADQLERGLAEAQKRAARLEAGAERHLTQLNLAEERLRLQEREKEYERNARLAEQSARTRAEQHLADLRQTRTFRYTEPARDAYSRLRRGRSPSANRLHNQPADVSDETPTSDPLTVGEASQAEFVPPGHFYSAIPSLEELESRRSEIFDKDPRDVPGVNLRVDEQLQLLARLEPLLRDVPFGNDPAPPLRYHFHNHMFDSSDGLFLHLMLRELRPSRIVEVGSGYSSVCMLDTIEYFVPGTRVTFVDPNATTLRSLLRTEGDEHVDIIESPVQLAPPSLFSDLRAGDLLFIDSTHVVKAGSDVNYLFFDVLPTLADGVVIHLHDIFPGFEYPWAWMQERRAWSEDYLLRAFLQYNADFQIELWPQFIALLHPEAYDPFASSDDHVGGSVYLRRTAK